MDGRDWCRARAAGGRRAIAADSLYSTAMRAMLLCLALYLAPCAAGRRPPRRAAVLIVADAGAGASEHAADITAATSGSGAPTAPARPWVLRVPRITKQDVYAVAGAAVGAYVGLAITPTKTDPLAGRVATPEAWRRRVKAKRDIPLIVRSPNILAAAVVGYSVVEYALAYPTHGALEAVYQTTAWRCGAAASAEGWVRSAGLRARLMETPAYARASALVESSVARARLRWSASRGP